MAKTATRQVSIFLNGKEVENSIKAIAAEQKKANNELSRMIIGTEEYVKKAADVQKLNGILAEHRQSLNGVKQGLELTKSSLDKYIGIAAGAFTVDAVLSFGKQLFNTGVQMEAMAKKAKTVFGEALPLVTQEAEKNARAMGLTNAQYVSAAANIQDLLIPMGFQRKEAANISTQLVNLSGALSEWTGGQRSAVEVSAILNKALLGEREELKSLGISINDADVKAGLAAKGLDKLTGAALEQAKATTTLELVLAKSTDAQAQFAQGSGSMARRQAEASAKLQEVAEKLSKVLLPVFERLLSLADGVSNFFLDLADGIGAVVDPAAAASKAFDEQANKVSNLEKNIYPLLGRYDELTSKTNLSKAEQGELKSIIEKVSGAIPSAVSGFDKYGEALGLNTTKAREFIEVEKARLKFVNQAAIKENEDFIKELERQSKEIISQLNLQKKDVAVRGAGGEVQTISRKINEDEIRSLQAEAAKLQETLKGANAELRRLRGETLGEAPVAATKTITGAPPPIDPDKAKKEAERLAKELEDLIKRTTELRLDLIAKEQDDELVVAIRGIEKRYDAEIAKAKELEAKGVKEATAQRVTLEKLKGDEISYTVSQNIDKEIDKLKEGEKKKKEEQLKAYEETLKSLDDKYKERIEKEAEIKDFENAGLLTSQQNELLQLETHYKTLLDYATKNGIDTVALTKAFEAQKTQITKDGSKERENVEKQVLENYAQLQIDRANAVAQGAAILGQFFEESSSVGKAFFLLEKAAAAVSVVLSLQKEKAAIFAAARLGTLFDPTGAAALALATPQVVAANIRAGINLATIAATAIKPFIKQKFTGGYHDVIGETDGRSYHARQIDAPNTGLLPNFPVLFRSNATGAPVLASERGREYFVSSRDLQNPAVANYVRMIDNITNGRVRQFADGGFNQAPAQPITQPAAADAAFMREAVAFLQLNTQLLNHLIQSGVIAVVPDGTLIDMNKRMGVLQKVSGNFF